MIKSVAAFILREKGSDMTQSHDKSPFTHRKIHTTIADRLRAISWNNDTRSYPTGVIKPVFGIPTSH